MHRDLKLGNILITHATKSVKIIDFGLAVKLEIGEQGEQKTLCGTPNYIAPEVLNSQPYGLQTDLWSVGCILYALLTGTPPFECPSVQDTLLKIRKGKFKLPDHMSEPVQDLVRKLLDSDPNNRITIQDVLEHPFLTEFMEKLKPPKLKEEFQIALKNNIETLAKKESELNDLLGLGDSPSHLSSSQPKSRKVMDPATSHEKEDVA